MSAKRNGWIGIDIGTRSVKLAQVRRTSSSNFELVASAIVQRDRTWSPSDLAASPPRSSIGELRAAREIAMNCTGRQTACAIPMSLCEVRTLERTSQDESSIEPLIADELKKIGSSGNYIADYCTGYDQNHLLAGFLPRRWSDQVASDTDRSSLDLESVEISPLTLAHATQLPSGHTPRSVYAILDWGASTTTLSIVKSGSSVFARKLPNVSFAQAASNIATAFELSEDEAICLLRSTGLPTSHDTPKNVAQHQNAISAVLSEFNERFRRELLRTLEFIESRHQEWKPSEVVLFGGGATIPNICEQISNWIDLPCSKWRFDGCDPAVAPILGSAIALSTRKWSAR